jgi:translation initiation factor 1
MEFLSNGKCDEAFDNEEEYEIQIVHIWLRQRNGKKCVTEVNGLASDLNLDKIMKFWRKDFHCSVSKFINEDKEKIIKLQGDKRELILQFLILENIISKANIKIHGY